MIARTLFREEHEIVRSSVRKFVEREIVPFHAQWEHDGVVPRELWLKAGAEGLLCCTVPEEYGGLGLAHPVRDYVLDGILPGVAGGSWFAVPSHSVCTYKLSVRHA